MKSLARIVSIKTELNPFLELIFPLQHFGEKEKCKTEDFQTTH